MTSGDLQFSLPPPLFFFLNVLLWFVWMSLLEYALLLVFFDMTFDGVILFYYYFYYLDCRSSLPSPSFVPFLVWATASAVWK